MREVVKDEGVHDALRQRQALHVAHAAGVVLGAEGRQVELREHGAETVR